jgi:hypothetical protein
MLIGEKEVKDNLDREIDTASDTDNPWYVLYKAALSDNELRDYEKFSEEYDKDYNERNTDDFKSLHETAPYWRAREKDWLNSKGYLVEWSWSGTASVGRLIKK